MKKAYKTPTACAEEFMPNEYVAVCWSVGCKNNTTYRNHNSNAPYGNRWTVEEGPYDRPFSHDGDCRNASNNYFRGNADGSNLSFVYEDSHDQGNLSGGLDRWVDNGDGVVGSGDVIYWHTSNGSRTWNHWGYVQTADSAHPNRS